MPLEYALQFRGRFPDPGPWKLPNSFTARLSEPLGISDLPQQRVRRSKRKPYVFNIMVVGESGLGKTTFMNTLFDSVLQEQKGPRDLTALKTVKINPVTYELVEDGVTLHLTVIDTPGFGDQMNRETNFDPIIDYIDTQYEAYLRAERSQEMRRNIQDSRVHCILYFLPPTGKGLRDIDIEFLGRLCTKVNIIPVISKADGLTREEQNEQKQMILQDIEKHDIRIYPTFYAEDRETLPDIERYIPFTVIGSDSYVESNGKKVRGRTYRWGYVEVENGNHCDFIYLRELLIRTNLQDLIETTHTIHYAQFRSSRIRAKGRPESFLACDEYFDSKIENERKALQNEMKQKEDEIRLMFVQKVKEKEAVLRESEARLSQRRKQLMEELEKKKHELELEEESLAQLERAKYEK